MNLDKSSINYLNKEMDKKYGEKSYEEKPEYLLTIDKISRQRAKHDKKITDILFIALTVLIIILISAMFAAKHVLK